MSSVQSATTCAFSQFCRRRAFSKFIYSEVFAAPGIKAFRSRTCGLIAAILNLFLVPVANFVDDLTATEDGIDLLELVFKTPTTNSHRTSLIYLRCSGSRCIFVDLYGIVLQLAHSRSGPHLTAFISVKDISDSALPALTSPNQLGNWNVNLDGLCLLLRDICMSSNQSATFVLSDHLVI